MRILILTGFDEFEYAKEAVRLEIDEYILKPVNAIELLCDCLKRLKNVLDREREEKIKYQKTGAVLYGVPSCPAGLIFSARLWKDRSPVGKYTNISVTIRISLPTILLLCSPAYIGKPYSKWDDPCPSSMSVQRGGTGKIQ